MTTIDKLTVDISQELIHDRIRAVAQTLVDTFGIKIEDISINWFDYIGTQSVISEIKIRTSKR